MSSGLNRALLLGNLGADPELRVVSGGQAVLKMRLATEESYVDRNNTRQSRTEWHRVTVWGRRAEALGKILGKGDRIFVEGRIQTSSYEKDGEKRYSTEIVAHDIILLGSRSGAAEADGGDRPRRGGHPAGTGGGGGNRSRAATPGASADDWADAAEPADGGGGGRDLKDDDIPF